MGWCWLMGTRVEVGGGKVRWGGSLAGCGSLWAVAGEWMAWAAVYWPREIVSLFKGCGRWWRWLAKPV